MLLLTLSTLEFVQLRHRKARFPALDFMLVRGSDGSRCSSGGRGCCPCSFGLRSFGLLMTTTLWYCLVVNERCGLVRVQ